MLRLEIRNDIFAFTVHIFPFYIKDILWGKKHHFSLRIVVNILIKSLNNSVICKNHSVVCKNTTVIFINTTYIYRKRNEKKQFFINVKKQIS